MFVFEGHEVEWIVDAMIQDPFRPMLSDAFASWRPLVEDEPRIARPVFSWQQLGSRRSVHLPHSALGSITTPLARRPPADAPYTRRGGR